MCGVSPPRAAIQRFTGGGYIEYSIWVASGLVIGAAVGAEIPRRVEPESGVRGHADLVMGHRAENDGAGGGAQAVDDHGLARAAQVLIFVDIGADPAATILTDTNHRMARANSCQQENRREQPRHQLHLPAPVQKPVEPESDRLP